MSNNNKTPAIRFKGFTDTWEQREVGELCSISTGKSNTQDKIDDGIYPFYVRSPIVENSNKYLYDEEAVITVGDGVGTGKVFHYVNGKYDLHRMYGFSEELDAKYFYHTFSLLFYKRVMAMTAKTSVDSVRLEMISDMEIPTPSIDEQLKIGQLFTNLDTLITLHQRKCDKLIQFKAAMLQKMFPQNGADKPEIRFKGFTDAWEQRKLEEVITVGNGMDYKHLSEGDIPVYGTGGYMLSVDKALSYDKDAIGIGRKGTIDKPYVLKAPFWTVDTLFYCIPKEDYSLDFVYCIFQNVNWKEKDESTGVPSLSKVNINSTDVKVPTLAEQEKIGAYFAQLDTLITIHQRKCDKYKSIKSGLIRKLFP